jgi:hypothetical protein
MLLKPTAGCQISILIFENKIVERGLYKYPIISQKWARTLPSLIYCLMDIYRDPLHNLFSNIKVDI